MIQLNIQQSLIKKKLHSCSFALCPQFQRYSFQIKMCVLRTLSPFQIGKVCCPDFIFMNFMMKKRKKIIFKNLLFFLSDLTTCHYLHSSQAWVHQNGLEFFPKDQNPPTAPQIRATEQFWSKKRYMREIGQQKTEIS